MESAATKLKELRKQASPPITVRGMADALGIPFGTYSTYEAASRYKKPTLPLDLARKVATVLAAHKVDPAEVMKLAGLTTDEAEPEVRALEAARPRVQYVPLQLALPSEDALRDMFRSLLDLAPHLLQESAARDELAEILAQRLPSGFAGIGPVLLDPRSAATTAADAIPPTPARDRPEPARASHT
jgi:hypothetical protein